MANRTVVTAQGPGAIKAVPDAVRCLNPCRDGLPRGVLVVSSGFGTRSWAPAARSALSLLGYPLLVHDGATTPQSVAFLANAMHAEQAEVAIALGGGTVLDAAKAAAALADSGPVDANQVIASCLGTASRRGQAIPVIAVPTTAGTGAEATPFATVWDLETGRKLSLAGPEVRPVSAVLDPDLLAGLGLHQLAAGLLDTLCQGSEAAWSINATAESIGWGLAAVEQAGEYLAHLAHQPATAVAWQALQRAGHSSGQAIALAQTSSCHAISYSLTLRLGLAHGHACGVSLGPMLRYNAAVTGADCADRRGPRHVREVIHRIAGRLGGAPTQAADRVERFLVDCGLARLEELPVAPDAVAAEALSYPRCHDNPRRLDGMRLSRLLSDPFATEEICG